MRKILIVLNLLCLFSMVLNAKTGIKSIKSPHSVEESVTKLENILKEKGMKVFITINHSEGAKSAGLELRPTVLVLFGNPKAGTPLMMTNQLSAIDLPQKVLVWEDKKGNVWLSYNDPFYLEKRHLLKQNRELINKISKNLENIVKQVIMS